MINKRNMDRAAALIAACLLWAFPAEAQDFRFDGPSRGRSWRTTSPGRSRSPSCSTTICTQPRNSRGVDPRDNLRLILDTKAKFVGRALMVWGREKELSAFLETAKPYADALHQADPEIILQAAAFEIVTPGVETVAIPERVLRRVRSAGRRAAPFAIRTCSTPTGVS